MKRGTIDLKGFDTPEMKKLVRESLESLRNDELVYPMISKELKLTTKEAEKFIGALLDYQEDAHYCAKCPGLDRCAKAQPHFRLHLARNGEVLDRHYDPCEKMISLSSFYERFIRCSFPAEWRDEGFNEIEPSVTVRKNLVGKMLLAAEGTTNDWFYLTGSTGSGKSFMLACLANEITKNKGPGAFCETESLLNELKEKSIKDHEGFEEMMKRLSAASILVLDDFGNEYKTEYVYTSVLFPLLSARDKAGLLTCFSSDFKIDEVVGMYKGKIGPERASQLENLLKRRCKKSYDVSSFGLYKSK